MGACNRPVHFLRDIQIFVCHLADQVFNLTCHRPEMVGAEATRDAIRDMHVHWLWLMARVVRFFL